MAPVGVDLGVGGSPAPGVGQGGLGITPRTLYRFIDEGQLPAYRFGRVIRLKENEVDTFIDACRIAPGSLEHLYPETIDSSATEPSGT